MLGAFVILARGTPVNHSRLKIYSEELKARLSDQDRRPEHPIILALDTSSRQTGIALLSGEGDLRSVVIESDEKRSEKLWSDIKALLSESRLGIKDITLFGVCVGPGGFTGLRVGMAAMKGLAAATSRPIVGVTSLEAAASQAKPSDVVCALVNAYKGEVYSQLFSVDAEGRPVALNSPLVSTLHTALERAWESGSAAFAGNAALENAALIESFLRTKSEREPSPRDRQLCVIEQSEARSLAVYIARLSHLRFKSGESGTAESLRACYVRPAEAEVKLSLGLLGTKVNRSLKR